MRGLTIGRGGKSLCRWIAKGLKWRPSFCSRKSFEFLVRRMGVFFCPNHQHILRIRNVILKSLAFFSKWVRESTETRFVSPNFCGTWGSNFWGDFCFRRTASRGLRQFRTPRTGCHSQRDALVAMRTMLLDYVVRLSAVWWHFSSAYVSLMYRYAVLGLRLFLCFQGCVYGRPCKLVEDRKMSPHCRHRPRLLLSLWRLVVALKINFPLVRLKDNYDSFHCLSPTRPGWELLSTFRLVNYNLHHENLKRT